MKAFQGQFFSILLTLSSVTGQESPSLNPASAPSPISTNKKREVIRADPGPWGSLEYYQIPLDCPTSSLQFLTTPSQQVEWHFPVGNNSELEIFLRESGISTADIELILRGANYLLDPEVLRVFPSSEAILGLAHESRSKLYRILATSGGNPFHERPIYIDSDNLSYWFEGSSVPRAAIADIAKLAYPTPRGKGYFLSDMPFTMRQASNRIEEKEILTGLLRKQGLIVRLRLTRESLTQEIADYWTAGYKNKAVMPIFESVVKANDGGAIDIAHLLPATPRQFLNRFPTPANGIHGRFPDWFWSCYNFFRFTPRDIYADSPDRDRRILSEFEPTSPPLQFGDMLLLNSGQTVIHGCVYIADDIAFTKNGADLFSPWVLMKIEDIVASQDLRGDVSLSVFRRRPPLAPSEDR